MSLNHIIQGGPGPNLPLRGSSLLINGVPITGGSSTDTLVETKMNFPGGDTLYSYRYTTLKIGSVTMVMLHLPSNIQSASGSDAAITFNASLPQELAPIASSYSNWTILCVNNSGFVNGSLSIQPTGFISITSGVDQDYFTGSGNCGIAADAFICWNLSNNQ